MGFRNSVVFPVDNLPLAAAGPGDQVLGRNYNSLSSQYFTDPLLDLDTSDCLPDVHPPLCRVWSDLQRCLLRRQVPRPDQPILGDAGEPHGPSTVSPPHPDWSSLHHAQVGCCLSLVTD